MIKGLIRKIRLNAIYGQFGTGLKPRTTIELAKIIEEQRVQMAIWCEQLEDNSKEKAEFLLMANADSYKEIIDRLTSPHPYH